MANMNLKQQILKKTQYKTIPQIFIQELGYEAALVLSHFIDLSQKLPEYFYQQSERLQYTLGLKRRALENALNLLNSKNLISIHVKKGAKTLYHLQVNHIEELIEKQVIGYKEAGNENSECVTGYIQKPHILHSSKLPVTSKDKSNKTKGKEITKIKKEVKIRGASPDQNDLENFINEFDY